MKKLCSLFVFIAAALAFCAVNPDYSGLKVFTAANYGSSKLEIYARTVASEINSRRAEAGLAPLKLCDSLNEAALIRAEECVVKFSHERPNGTICFTVLDEANVPYYSAGENIAYGQTSPQKVMSAWMNSSEHRANILSADFEYVGIGVKNVGGTYYWTQFFTGGVKINGEIAPFITEQPKSVKTSVGGKARFEIKAEGSNLSYQWYYKKKGASGWTLWNGHTSAVATGNANDSWHGMKVHCVITDSKGMTLTSDSAEITLVAPPVITSQPHNVTVAPGAKANFEVKAQGKGLKYQWYFKKKDASQWSLWKSHTSASVSVTANSTWGGMKVYCRVSDPTGAFVNSDSATVTLIHTISILRNPEDAHSAAGKSVSFSVIANGDSLKYQWYIKKNGATEWSKWSNHTQPIFTEIASSDWNGMKVRCSITDISGKSINSSSAKVIFDSGVTIKSGPSNIAVRAGEKVTFSASATGENLTCQWYYKKANATGWSIWNGHNTTSTSAVSNSTWEGMKVLCIFTDKYGNTASTGCATIYII